MGDPFGTGWAWLKKFYYGVQFSHFDGVLIGLTKPLGKQPVSMQSK
jgi:hypothetical protein